MTSLIIIEYGELRPSKDAKQPQYSKGKWLLPAYLWNRLKTFDQVHAGKNKDETVFDWNNPRYAKAKSYVGIVQIPGLTIEILPKICDMYPKSEKNDAAKTADERIEAERKTSRESLLFMLSYINKIPLLRPNNASLRLEKMTFFDALIALFADMLNTELGRGIDHAYYYREENLCSFKGKLLVNQHIRHNAAHQERVFVGFDEFVSDTWLNRIIKKCCRVLIGRTTNRETEKNMRKALLILDEVSDREIIMQDFDRIPLNRNTERFRDIIDFCRLILQQRSPGFEKSQNNTFSLLFPMEQVFEEFVAAVIKRSPEFSEYEVECQKPWDFATSTPDQAPFRIRPDIILRNKADGKVLVLDTKWKLLDANENHFGISQEDMFQMYAYTGIMGCKNALLLYPAQKKGVGKIKSYSFSKGGAVVAIKTVGVDFSNKEFAGFAGELKGLVERYRSQPPESRSDV
jgi:5-methylcytosine-specific restriction enzyme subunit McrC